MQDLATQIKRDEGLKGKPRKEKEDKDKIRKGVQAAIRTAVKEINKNESELAEHINDSLKCGWKPCYTPDDKIDWEL